MVKPKKHLGQHFLKDLEIANKIASLLKKEPFYEEVLEIGPGMGVLTNFLFQKYPCVHAIEIDKESVIYLKQKFSSFNSQNRLIEADFLNLDIKQTFLSKIALIGNFPYNISSQIFFKVLENIEQIPQVVCMLQKEVAERIASKPGNKTYGILSVLLQAYYDIEYHFTVDADKFLPPPKVKSGVISLCRNSRTQLFCDEKLFVKVVKMAFNQRRKMLRNALSAMINIEALREDKMLNMRAEQLSVEAFIELTKKIQEQGLSNP